MHLCVYAYVHLYFSVLNLFRQTYCLLCNAGEVLTVPAPPSASTQILVSSGRPAALLLVQERGKQSQPLPLHRHYVLMFTQPLFHGGAYNCLLNPFSMGEPSFVARTTSMTGGALYHF